MRQRILRLLFVPVLLGSFALLAVAAAPVRSVAAGTSCHAWVSGASPWAAGNAEAEGGASCGYCGGYLNVTIYMYYAIGGNTNNVGRSGSQSFGNQGGYCYVDDTTWPGMPIGYDTYFKAEVVVTDAYGNQYAAWSGWHWL